MERTMTVRELCEMYTHLLDKDIQILENLSTNLSLIANLNKANVFIDCPVREGKHAIVVAEACGHSVKSVYDHPVVGKFAYEAFEPAVFYVLRTGKDMFVNRALTQEGAMVQQSVVPVKGECNRVIAVLIMEKVIHEEPETSKQFDRQDQQNSLVPEFIEESIFLINNQNRLVYTNPAAINLVSEICLTDCVLGESVFDYFPGFADVLASKEDILVKEMNIGKKIFQIKKFHLGNKNSNETFIIIRDLTELRDKERELISKSVAIREIHHRVKNNLQTVASLLRLQMRIGAPEESKPHLLVSLNRVLSISSVYEIILASSQVDHVDLLELIRKIGDMIVHTEEHARQSLSIEYSGDELHSIDSDIGISVALVVNELIHNCVKHAFEEGTEGKITVCFQKDGPELEIQVRDDGIGYSQALKPSLGLDIIRMTVENDLDGEFSIHRIKEGTLASVRFPYKR
ncbi:sensor histidine kinase [Peribacillus simplex]|uniref:histidine kinase n=2 Tax=Peribacillus TaxID=2675229 RepID=A0AA90PB86_9BACI|nr:MULTISPECIES: sensor histidine kinase [Peribacillus]MDP1419556.1 sensor histidine kinase [Peribacillus simplex]MDP1452523.1 sensor histidine kinase [Peribacillus frigoritolerans]